MRMSLSKSLRFDVFKRDGFICQYCGAHPPEAVLEVDHIHPVSEGGENGLDNLITACFACNRGKSAGLLSDVPNSLSERAAETAEREEQIAGFEAIMRARRTRIEADAYEALEAFCSAYRKESIPNADFASIKRFIEKLGLSSVLDAVEIAHSKKRTYRQAFPYFCGVCWNKIKRNEGAAA